MNSVIGLYLRKLAAFRPWREVFFLLYRLNDEVVYHIYNHAYIKQFVDYIHFIILIIYIF